MPETALRPQKRAEGLSGGAAKNSYVKCGGVAGSYFTHHVVTQTESREKKPSGRSRVVFYWFFCSPRSNRRSTSDSYLYIACGFMLSSSVFDAKKIVITR